ncbi:pyridoxine/pyridoxamine 5'-phosphate oxidase [Marmoricola endophyticus]|uniref:Pyridoxine/pyridoxamine 5'-phosphate oxidase n=1 Tax=Marmoricola endophyticus TaxID=2040280 RepID=A0A917F2G9_9ACTN|nr:pyridoxamine 5'-phosphate oxidase [Marmoricola endophyticus]GGF41781.1 pyridoxine/pyridoxamine 5'-phosphate oxidase [Marmoricola endophyticus]
MAAAGEQHEFGRVDYTLAGLDESDLTADPLDLFGRWYDEAGSAGVPEPNAMVLSTVSEGRPSSRTVLLKDLAADGVPGFVLYTNRASRKGSDLARDPRCALHFGWYPLQRQVRVEGVAQRVSQATSEAYFASRPRASQLGAWASVEPVAQSQVVADRAALEASYEAAEQRFDGGEVPCPPSWGGFLVVPLEIEFWQGRHGRVHDRLRYRRDNPDGDWGTERLAP